ncbi:hypothetical protein [Acanthopleuribacter pedis]|uniref:Uncharacterized protein n=1 Tax=Acanthopleuribacter pedis TaxID=442870 RepID=A0A8J7Q4Z4_9BACT|nr:hypothetical protein [Acanthopleuribacter pedis]MBO1319155.1 hypothetical protein [Acanthopleuribacter pedis]
MENALEIWYQGIGQVWYMSRKNYTTPTGAVVVDGVMKDDIVKFINGDPANSIRVTVPVGVFNGSNPTVFTLSPHGQPNHALALQVAMSATFEPCGFKFLQLDPANPELEDDPEKETNGQIIILDDPSDPDV